MSGRGRARPPSRSAQDPAAGPSRRSTRHQQQQQNATPAQADQADPKDELQQEHQDQQQQQGQQGQALAPQVQAEAAMVVPVYDQNIDPAITGAQDGTMPPPPVPAVKNARGQTPAHPARRGTRRDDDVASSINSVAPTDMFSSHPELQSSAQVMSTPGRLLATLGRAASVVSSVTDTPAKKKARANLIPRRLPRLFAAADELATHLGSPQGEPAVWEEERAELKRVLDATRSTFVASISDPVVLPSFVTEVMGVEQGSPQWYKALRIVTITNLVTLLNDITPANPQGLFPLLQEWDATFHECFVAGIQSTGDSQLEERAYDQLYWIRSHRSIFTLQKLRTDSPVSFHPRAELAKIWCEGDISLEAIRAFLDNDSDALQLRAIADAGSEVAAMFNGKAATRIRSFCNMLPNEVVDGNSLDLTELEYNFPFDSFIEDLRAFATDSFVRIKNQLLQSDPSLFAASDAASGTDSQIRSQLEADSQAQAYNRTVPGVPSTPYDMKALQMLKQLEQGHQASYGDHQLPPGSYSAPPRIPYPPDFASGLEYSDASQHGGFPSSGSMYAASAAQVTDRKRKGQDGLAATGDDPAASTAQPAKKPRVRKPKNVVPEADMTVAAPASSSAPMQSGAPPMHHQYPPLPGTQDEPDFEALSQRTKELSAVSRKVKEPQVRQPWTQKDTRLLVKAVSTYKAKWSAIEKEIKAGTIPFERPRDQQALRDKARLLKQDFLKADAVLPRDFDLVVLGKKEKEAVKAVGKNPDRKEADVDENGRPINTEWRGDNAEPTQVPAVDPMASAEVQPGAQSVAPEQGIA
ncbi:hypothetical protein VTJ49DRAFT_2098 [Mycothermus thermophilus]|uniref:Myb-like domain-containing protein n=1 Tax=Humicola insolens TaxID=85995 RepID=A0ABR3VAM2_HUMIN